MALPAYAPGSRLQLSGVCDFATAAAVAGGAADESPSTGALKILVAESGGRGAVERAAVVDLETHQCPCGRLLTVLVVSMLRIQLLRRRLERQLAISRQMLEGQESERHRIAANLHDSLGQNLLVIKNQARLAMQPAADEARCASGSMKSPAALRKPLRRCAKSPTRCDRISWTGWD
jgi:signal transduction histidine kinase